MSRKRIAALVGNPNAGKSALFNALTGARQKIAVDVAARGHGNSPRRAKAAPQCTEKRKERDGGKHTDGSARTRDSAQTWSMVTGQPAVGEKCTSA